MKISRKFLYIIATFLLAYSLSRYFIFSMEREEPPTKKHKTAKEEEEEFEEIEPEEKLQDPLILKTSDDLEYPIEWNIANKLEYIRATVELGQKQGIALAQDSKYPVVNLDLTSKEIIPFIELLKIHAEIENKKLTLLQGINKVVDLSEINQATQEKLNDIIAMSDYYGFSDVIIKGLLRQYAKILYKKIKPFEEDLGRFHRSYKAGTLTKEEYDQLTSARGIDLAITLPREELITELAQQYWLLYYQYIDPTIIFSFSIKDLLAYGVELNPDDQEGHITLNLSNLEINDLTGLLEINGINQVIRLILSDNDITSLPATILNQLPQLKILEIEVNQLEQLPDHVFDNLINLTVLDLTQNKLISLPENIFNALTQLEDLSLGSNNLTELSAIIFNTLQNLKTLRLYDNKLTSLPETIFSSLSQLEELNLNGNNISILQATIFNALTQLQSLNLAGNNISELPTTIFQNLGMLRELNLSENPLVTLDLTLFDSLVNLQTLNLEGTQLSQEFITALKQRPVMQDAEILSDYEDSNSDSD